mmetsp:Transcript_9084/g.31868  ORF Transcript_9084/g.31868 Transcript_9084/m.31868 type:complete len:220 (+) Transcript_9084:147-806(+)
MLKTLRIHSTGMASTPRAAATRPPAMAARDDEQPPRRMQSRTQSVYASPEPPSRAARTTGSAHDGGTYQAISFFEPMNSLMLPTAPSKSKASAAPRHCSKVSRASDATGAHFDAWSMASRGVVAAPDTRRAAAMLTAAACDRAAALRCVSVTAVSTSRKSSASPTSGRKAARNAATGSARRTASALASASSTSPARNLSIVPWRQGPATGPARAFWSSA